MNQKWRTEHNILLPRHLVHKMMAELDPEGLEARNLQRKRKKAKGHFSSKGLLRLVSLDGHEELCGYQNSTFPLRVYGCIDSFSCKVLFLFVCYSNSNPMIIGRMYLQYLFETEVLPIAFFPNDKNRLWRTIAKRHGIQMRENISIRLLLFASLASTLLVIFEEWQKGTQQNTVVGENVIRTLDILRDCRRKLILFAFRSQEGFGTIWQNGKEPNKTQDWKGQTLAVFVLPQGFPESQTNF